MADPIYNTPSPVNCEENVTYTLSDYVYGKIKNSPFLEAMFCEAELEQMTGDDYFVYSNSYQNTTVNTLGQRVPQSGRRTIYRVLPYSSDCSSDAWSMNDREVIEMCVDQLTDADPVHSYSVTSLEVPYLGVLYSIK